MARGWESKSVEAQMESAQSPHPSRAALLSAEERARLRELEGLELSRTRVQHDLAAATHPRHRELLESALKHLEKRIAVLKPGVPDS